MNDIPNQKFLKKKIYKTFLNDDRKTFGDFMKLGKVI